MKYFHSIWWNGMRGEKTDKFQSWEKFQNDCMQEVGFSCLNSVCTSKGSSEFQSKGEGKVKAEHSGGKKTK